MTDASINELEQLTLLAVARLGREGYGVTIRHEIEERGLRPVSLAAVYAALDRMESRGLVTSWLSEPTRQRGGRARKHFELLPAGARAAHQARQRMDRMWDGLSLDPEGAR
jgi:PadR family transcriptional regulator PadR